jgi:hypothetical protein
VPVAEVFSVFRFKWVLCKEGSKPRVQERGFFVNEKPAEEPPVKAVPYLLLKKGEGSNGSGFL